MVFIIMTWIKEGAACCGALRCGRKKGRGGESEERERREKGVEQELVERQLCAGLAASKQGKAQLLFAWWVASSPASNNK